jgi:hypothetical protein
MEFGLGLPGQSKLNTPKNGESVVPINCQGGGTARTPSSRRGGSAIRRYPLRQEPPSADAHRVVSQSGAQDRPDVLDIRNQAIQANQAMSSM